MMEVFSGIASVFMLHRVFPYEPENIVYNENMKLSPDELEMIILELKDQNVEFISLDELKRRLTINEKPEKRAIVFTLDDGYKDNFTHAYPVFKKHNIPFCIYITNSFPNRTTNLWWYALDRLVMQNESLTIAGRRRNNRMPLQKQRNFLSLRTAILNQHYFDPLSYLRQAGNLTFDPVIEANDKCLTWNEIQAMASDPLVTIGCHTMNHYPVSKLTAAQARSEIADSKTELESKLGKPVRHFAFPFGSRREAGLRDYEIASAVGFDSVVTTVHGHIHREADAQCLNRIFLFPLVNNSTTLNRVMYWNIRSAVAFIKNLISRL